MYGKHEKWTTTKTELNEKTHTDWWINTKAHKKNAAFCIGMEIINKLMQMKGKKDVVLINIEWMRKQLLIQRYFCCKNQENSMNVNAVKGKLWVWKTFYSFHSLNLLYWIFQTSNTSCVDLWSTVGECSHPIRCKCNVNNIILYATSFKYIHDFSFIMTILTLSLFICATYSQRCCTGMSSCNFNSKYRINRQKIIANQNQWQYKHAFRDLNSFVPLDTKNKWKKRNDILLKLNQNQESQKVMWFVPHYLVNDKR